MRKLNRARKVASSSRQNFKHAAIVFKGGAILGEAHNTLTHHAEVGALMQARFWHPERKVRGLTVLSVRVTDSGRLRCAKPCATCRAYMKEWGVVTVLFSTDEGLIERIRL